MCILSLSTPDRRTWQLPRVQTVYGCYVTVIAIFHYNRLVHVILTIFPAVRMGLSCSWKQLFAVGSTTEVKQKSSEQRSSCKVPTLAWSRDRYWSGMGVTATVQCITQLGFTVVMWLRSEIWLILPTFRQRSNNLNSRKLPGRFSYGLGTRLLEMQNWGLNTRRPAAYLNAIGSSCLIPERSMPSSEVPLDNCTCEDSQYTVTTEVIIHR